MTDVIDTLEISGGRALVSVDAAAVHEAASNAERSSDRLRVASFRVTQAVGALEALVQPSRPAFASHMGSLGDLRPYDADSAVRLRVIADDARVLARHLAARADDCALLRERLLRAAGLYEEGESFAEQAVGVLVGVGAAGVSFALSTSSTLRWTVAAGAAVGAGAMWLGDRIFGDEDDGKVAKKMPDSGKARGSEEALDTGSPLVAAFGPWSDEAMSGAAFGIAAARPFDAGFDFSVTGAATVLSDLLRRLLPLTEARVREVRPADLVSSGQAAPTGSIAAAFTKIEGLYGRGPDGEPLDVPPGTIAVERVTREDGTTSWVVTIVGTQDFLSATNPFDGKSDVDIMSAHHTAETAAATEAALAAAGAQPDEPVVLIGHSLGGLTAVALAESASFRQKHRIGGVVTAGAPTSTFTTPSGVPVIHIENDEELVSNLDGRSGGENPRRDRVTVTRQLAASSDPLDRAAAGSIGAAHGIATHGRTLDAGLRSGNVQLAGVVERVEALMTGVAAQTQYYQAERVEIRAPELVPTPSPGPSPVPDVELPLEKLPGIGPIVEDMPGVGAPPLTVGVPPLSLVGPSSGRGG